MEVAKVEITIERHMIFFSVIWVLATSCGIIFTWRGGEIIVRKWLL